MDAVKKFSPAVFGIIIFCFFLPFVNLTCSGQTVMKLTGFQLITGADMDQSSFLNQEGMFNQGMQDQPAENQGVEAQPLALFALLAAVLGLLVSFVRKKTTAFVCVIIGAAGAIFLLLLKFSLDGDASLKGEGVVQLDYQFGYWFSVLLFIASAVLNWLMFKEKPQVVNIIPEVPPTQ
ncbi:MAG TPA: hypothetical protein VLN45_03435 [Ignavibacteriaceae bacterium]|nr:hypothetical protein [Ignavibacteriaceae bacterium]